MAQIKGTSACDRPPYPVRICYKKYSKISLSEVGHDMGILDLQRLDRDQLPTGVTVAKSISSQDSRLAFDDFISGGHHPVCEEHAPLSENIPVYAHNAISGLLMIPAFFPPTVQVELLSRLFHRDLSCPEHQTNLHLHYDVTYPEDTEGTHMPKSFFEDDSARILQSKDPEVHEPVSVQTLLERKLRWVTLGGHHDRTAQVHPSGTPPEFPPDIANLIHAAFPETTAQTAILNLRSAGDTLSLRRGVSNDSDVGFISMSFGCDGLFLASHDDGNGCEIIRLRSGDIVYMTGKSRFAWHGVPKILPSTCPAWLKDWPSFGNSGPGMPPGPYEMWKGWISSKRINLDVRQMNVHLPEG